MYAHFLYSTSCHKHFCKVNDQKEVSRVEHSLYLPRCLKEVRIFDGVFSGLLLHSAWCSHILQKEENRSVLFITFEHWVHFKFQVSWNNPFSFLFLSCTRSCPALLDRGRWQLQQPSARLPAHPPRPLLSFLTNTHGYGYVGTGGPALPLRSGQASPRSAEAVCRREQARVPGGSPRLGCGMVLLALCSALEASGVWWFVLLQVGVYRGGFYCSVKQLQYLGQLAEVAS